MKGTMIHTPEGHAARLIVRFGKDGTTVEVQCGELSVYRESKKLNDVDLISECLRTMDDLMMNISDYQPHTDEIPWSSW
ncbi:MAG: hypothetical protein ACYC6A_21580 [Armatimonadota bacterium]